jgi:putative phosphoribosyl transferase
MLSEREVNVRADGVKLPGSLAFPFPCNAVVLFAHGSGSSRHSPRNNFVAGVLQQAGLGTLLVDLLTADEEQIDLRSRELRFDIDLLARRLVGILEWVTAQPDTQGLPVGLFGASTGAAGALIAAAQRPDVVAAVVSRGGRPDLAGPSLGAVQAPTLLIVGGADTEVIELNRQAERQLPPDTETQLEIVPGAGHLFEEPGTLEKVAELARDFFARHLAL